MLSYSPYDNVGAKAYPHLLIRAGLNDTRVMYWEPAKWAAKLRVNSTGEYPLMFKTEMGAGHGGPSGRYDRYRKIAYDYAFIFDCLDMLD
jgi:oligopeptidase B